MPAHRPLALTPQDVRSIRLFAGLSDAEVERVLAMLSPRRVAGRTTLLLHQSMADMVGFVRCGAFRVVCVSPRGVAMTLYQANAGDTFGHVAAILGERFSVQIRLVADGAGELMFMPASDFLALVESVPHVCHATLRAIASICKTSAGRIYELGTLNVATRLNGALVHMARGAVEDGGRRILTPAPTHSTIATLIGATREAVTRHLTKLERANIVRLERGSIEFLDLAKLEALDASEAGERFSNYYEEA